MKLSSLGLAVWVSSPGANTLYEVERLDLEASSLFACTTMCEVEAGVGRRPRKTVGASETGVLQIGVLIPCRLQTVQIPQEAFILDGEASGAA